MAHELINGTLLGATANPKWASPGPLPRRGVTSEAAGGPRSVANAREYSGVFSDAVGDFNCHLNQPHPHPCSGASPDAGSAEARALAAGFGCDSRPWWPQTMPAGHIRWQRFYIDAATGSPPAARTALLSTGEFDQWSLGFETCPAAFLRGLDVQATWYSVKINSVLQAFNNPTAGPLGNAPDRFIISCRAIWAARGEPDDCEHKRRGTRIRRPARLSS